ncbi:MAG: YdcF family protein [Comamonadaceae bacterium CG17_big_fil_post_rev_8_21_14_2_50_60_13]|nr:MAG: YdcF family protein [Comamonadaceae bacterium CG17_big_fil_post_rev_8_21_14_2_50_60_13]
MMFIAAKFMAFLTQPLAWVALLLLLTVLLVRRRPAWAVRVGSAALALLLLLGWEPLPDTVLRHLESLYPPVVRQQIAPDTAGVIVLGGALESAYVWSVPGQSALNDGAERMTEAVALLRQQPQLKLVFTGGEGELFGGDLPEAARASVFFEGQGIPAARVLFESASRTTYENAVLSKRLSGIDAAQPWLLLTSASHMPRAMAAFRKAGWNVTAYPVDFRAGKATPWTQYTLDQGVKKWRIGLHEVIGLLAYRLSGRA